MRRMSVSSIWLQSRLALSCNDLTVDSGGLENFQYNAVLVTEHAKYVSQSMRDNAL